MLSSLIVFGKSLSLNGPFLDYIKSELPFMPDSINFFEKNDTNIFENLEKIILKSNKILIFASRENFNFIAKIISTLCEDSLEFKEETLIPSKSIDFSKNTFLIKYKNCLINTLLVYENEELPEILLTNENRSKTFSLIGVDKESAKILTQPLAQTYEVDIETSLLVEGWSIVEAKAKKYGDIEHFLQSVSSLFPDKYLQSDKPVEHIVKKLIQHNKTITTAESCTGGRLASMITSISGSSKIFHGSVVSYANHIKEAWLNVDRQTIENYGAVSELCVREMLEGSIKLTNSDFSLATSGIAGPTGGTKEKPVGTVYVGARNKKGDVLIERLLLKGNRNYIQIQSCYHAFRLLFILQKDI